MVRTRAQAAAAADDPVVDSMAETVASQVHDESHNDESPPSPSVIQQMQAQMLQMQLQFEDTIRTLTAQMQNLRHRPPSSANMSPSSSFAEPPPLADPMDEVESDDIKALYKVLKFNSQKR